MAGDRGTIKLDVTPSPGHSPEPESSDSFAGCGCLGFLLVAMLVVGMCNDGPADYPSPLDSGSRIGLVASTTTVTVPGFVAIKAERRVNDELRRYSVVFAFDNVRIVTVSSLSEIPRRARNEAINESRTPDAFLRSLGSASSHIVSGDVDITVGDLFATDELSVRMAIREQDVKDVSLVLSQAPRGPPSLVVPDSTAATVAQLHAGSSPSEGTLLPLDLDLIRSLSRSQSLGPLKAVDQWPGTEANRPLRTIYVVGSVNKFTGPDQYHSSVLHAQVIDLAPKEQVVEGTVVTPQREGYKTVLERRTEPWRIEPAVLATAMGAAAYSRATRPTGGFRTGPGGGKSAPKPPKPPPPRPRKLP